MMLRQRRQHTIAAGSLCLALLVTVTFLVATCDARHHHKHHTHRGSTRWDGGRGPGGGGGKKDRGGGGEGVVPGEKGGTGGGKGSEKHHHNPHPHQKKEHKNDVISKATGGREGRGGGGGGEERGDGGGFMPPHNERRNVLLHEAVRKLLGFQSSPQGSGGRRQGRTLLLPDPRRPPPMPKYVLDLYEKYRSGEMREGPSLGNTVRSIPAEIGEVNGEAMFIFNLSSIAATERVLRAHVHLYKRKSTHRKRRGSRMRTETELVLYEVAPHYLSQTGSIIMRSSAKGWQWYGATDAVLSCLLVDRQHPHLFALSFRAEKPNGKVRKLALKRFVRHHSLPFLILYSNETESVNLEELDIVAERLKQREDEEFPQNQDEFDEEEEVDEEEEMGDDEDKDELDRDVEDMDYDYDDIDDVFGRDVEGSDEEEEEDRKEVEESSVDLDDLSEDRIRDLFRGFGSNRQHSKKQHKTGHKKKQGHQRKYNKNNKSKLVPDDLINPKVTEKSANKTFEKADADIGFEKSNIDESFEKSNTDESFEKSNSDESFEKSNSDESLEKSDSSTTDNTVVDAAAASQSQRTKLRVSTKKQHSDSSESLLPSSQRRRKRSILTNEIPEDPSDYPKYHYRFNLPQTHPGMLTSRKDPRHQEEESRIIPYPKERTQSRNKSQQRRRRKHRKRKNRRRNRKNRRRIRLPEEWEDYHDNLATPDNNPGQVCARRRLVVDFADIGWGDWIISPKSFEAHYCSGSCPFPLTKRLRPSNHATIQSIVNAIGLYSDVPAPCCVPDTMTSVTLLYFDENRNVVLKNYPGMSVQSCACR